MRLAFWALGALFVGALVAHFLLGDQGYVLITFRGYLVEMSVPALVLVLVVLYASVRLLKRLWHAPRALAQAWVNRGGRTAGARLTRGLMHMAEGEFDRGEQLLTRGLKNSAAPLVNYLLAARAAHSQGARERRNEWLKLAYEALPDAEITVLLTQAELELEDGELERALATAQRILDKEPANRAALALLARTKLALGDRLGLVELLPRLAHAKLATEQLADIAARTFEAVLANSDLKSEIYATLWKELPAAVRKTPKVLRMHARILDQFGKGDEAISEILRVLKRSWEPDLVRAYGEVAARDALKQLRRAEGWLKTHAEDAVLLLTAARLCMANELWGKARSYLESSLALAPNPESYALYGKLLDQLGNPDQAALAYHSGLSLVAGSRPERPALSAPAKARRA
jgi:HemY protein